MLRALPFVLIVPLLGAPSTNIDEFFERFTADWVRADPQAATMMQFFTGPEQDKLDRLLTPQNAGHRKARLERARRALTELRRFDPKRLTPSQRVSARMLEWQMDALVKGAKYDTYSYVFNQGIGGQPGALVRFLTDTHPARNSRDVENYLARLASVAPAMDEAIAEARDRAKRGIVPPRFILTATMEQAERLAAPAPADNVLVALYAQRMGRSASIAEADRRKFKDTASKIVAESVVPALRRVIQLLEEQRKTATDEAGFDRLPDGVNAYAVRLRESTSTSMTADQIHRTGLEQVARLEAEMDAVLRKLGYNEGSVNERYRKAQDEYSYPQREGIRDTILADYGVMIRDAEKRAAALFDLRPKAPVTVVRIPEYAERNAAANYSAPARDGSKPGNFNVPLVGPTFSKLGMRTLAYHEAVPGHHFQIALQQENTELPRFRQNRITREGIVAFAEGWGLYAEKLALEHGWYDDDLPSKLGALNGQLFRARRLVVDTGLHAKKWTRQQVIDYGISVSETERYVVAPGQATAYMIGQLKLLELRDKAKRELDDRFSLKEFHDVVLRTGTVPLEVLEELIGDYIASKK